MNDSLTRQALERVLSGKTDGAGTDICATCAGPKEDSRSNSNRCRACEGGASPSTRKRE